MLSLCSSTICATAAHSLSLSASEVTFGTSDKRENADEYKLCTLASDGLVAGRNGSDRCCETCRVDWLALCTL